MAKHNEFFFRSLEHVELAKKFIEIHLPPYLKKLVDIENISRVDRTNTDKNLSKRHRDIIYHVPLKNKADGSLIVAIEHQSTKDNMLPIRFLRYTADNLEAWTNRGKKKWPTLVNLLLYHGKGSPYPDPCDTNEFYENPLLGNKELYLCFHTINLMQISDEEILTHSLCAPMEVLLKHSKDGILELPTLAYQNVFQICIEILGDDYLFSLLKYVDSIKNIEVGKKLHKFIEEVFENKKDSIMTYGQFLKQEGKQEGIVIGVEKGIEIGKKAGVEKGIEIGVEKGKKEGKKESIGEIAKKMLLNLNLDMDTVQRVTELPKSVLEKILQESR
jgi:predicted transposase/invertase (TIGR01784 family)